MENYRKKEQQVAEKYNQHVKLVPDPIFPQILFEPVHPDSEAQIHADCGIEQEFYKDESW
jgi:hypothetical protein